MEDGEALPGEAFRWTWLMPGSKSGAWYPPSLPLLAPVLLDLGSLEQGWRQQDLSPGAVRSAPLLPFLSSVWSVSDLAL